MKKDIKLGPVSDIAEALYLLARFSCHDLGSSAGGRVWERRVASALSPAGAYCWQGPGNLTLFGTRAASGVRHELDGAGSANGWTLMVEAKCLSAGLTKDQLCCFDRKTFDLYVARRRAGESGPHYRMVASASPVEPCLYKYGYLYGIAVIDPEMVPLPKLLRIAAKPNADEFLRNGLLSDLLLFGETACGPLEDKSVPDGPHHIRFNVHEFSERDLDDLYWLHRTISEDLLELIDATSPGLYEAKADIIFDRIGVSAYS
jgi:hypothetical protein